jgi:hypothetical protein
MDLFRQNIKKIIALTHSISAKSQQQPKNHRLSPLLTNFGKKLLRLHCWQFKSLLFYFFFFNFLHIDPSNDFCFCKFFAKGLRGEGERLKLKFWTSEIVKIGRDQHNYCRCHRFQSFVMMKTTV